MSLSLKYISFYRTNIPSCWVALHVLYLWFSPYVQCLGSICEFGVDGWEKLFGTNSSSFHHKWAMGRNFNGTKMSLDRKIKEHIFPCILVSNVWTRKGDFLSVCHLAERESSPGYWGRLGRKSLSIMQTNISENNIFLPIPNLN